MNRVFYELKFSGKLPSPDGVGMQILQLTQQEDCGLDEITKVVRADPSLTGRILKVANSLNASGSPAIPLEEAVLRIGFASLRDLVLGFSLISNNRTSQCPGFDYGAFWHLSLGRAVASQYLSEITGKAAGSESYVCGLLCAMGRLGMAAAHPDRYGSLLRQPEAEQPDGLATLEARTFGINHRELTHALLGDWGFPDRIARAASAYELPVAEDSPEPRQLKALRSVLHLGDRVAGELATVNGTPDRCSDELRRQLVEEGLPDDGVMPILTAIRTTWREWGALLNVNPPRVLPRTEKAPAPKAAVETPAVTAARELDELDELASKKLMLLETEDRMAASMELWLRPAGLKVIRTRSVRESLELAVTQAPPVVIARGEHGDLEALELCRALRSFEAGRRIYFILATGSRDPRRVDAGFAAGVDDFLFLTGGEQDGLLRLRVAKRVVQLRARLASHEKALQQNLAELAVANRKLHRAAMTDELTQLPNRRFAEDTMREAWEEAVRRDEDLALIVGDLDEFKKVNDTHGHLAGDLVLSSVARVFRQSLRNADVACRLGGEEFLVICPKSDLAAATACAERLRQLVAGTAVAVAGLSLRITVSLGVASRRDGDRRFPTVEALFAEADAAAYDSKRGGRNRVSVRHLP